MPPTVPVGRMARWRPADDREFASRSHRGLLSIGSSVDRVADDEQNDEPSAADCAEAGHAIRFSAATRTLPPDSGICDPDKSTRHADRRDEDSENGHDRGHETGASRGVEFRPIHVSNVLRGCAAYRAAGADSTA